MFLNISLIMNLLNLQRKIFCVHVNTTHALLCHCVFLFDHCMMDMISLVMAMMMFNAAVTSPLFPAEGKHLLIETEDSESNFQNHHSETAEETTPYTGAYVKIGTQSSDSKVA